MNPLRAAVCAVVTVFFLFLLAGTPGARATGFTFRAHSASP